MDDSVKNHWNSVMHRNYRVKQGWVEGPKASHARVPVLPAAAADAAAPVKSHVITQNEFGLGRLVYALLYDAAERLGSLQQPKEAMACSAALADVSAVAKLIRGGGAVPEDLLHACGGLKHLLPLGPRTTPVTGVLRSSIKYDALGLRDHLERIAAECVCISSELDHDNIPRTIAEIRVVIACMLPELHSKLVGSGEIVMNKAFWRMRTAANTTARSRAGSIGEVAESSAACSSHDCRPAAGRPPSSAPDGTQPGASKQELRNAAALACARSIDRIPQPPPPPPDDGSGEGVQKAATNNRRSPLFASCFAAAAAVPARVARAIQQYEVWPEAEAISSDHAAASPADKGAQTRLLRRVLGLGGLRGADHHIHEARAGSSGPADQVEAACACYMSFCQLTLDTCEPCVKKALEDGDDAAARAQLSPGADPDLARRDAIRLRMACHAEVKAAASAATDCAAPGDAIVLFVSRPMCANCQKALAFFAKQNDRLVIVFASGKDPVVFGS